MIEFRVRMLEAEDDFPVLDVVIKKVPPMHVLSMPVGKNPKMATVAKEINSAIASGAIRYAGIEVDQLSEGEIGREFNLDLSPFEAILEVRDDQPGDVELESQGVLVLRDEPAIETAATLMIYGGEREDRYEKVVLLQQWAVAHRYRLGKRLRALNHRGPLETLDRSEWVTEFQLAVKPG
jgi:hypothetical protein